MDEEIKGNREIETKGPEGRNYNVHNTLMIEACNNYAKSEVSLSLLVQILGKLEGRDTAEIWSNVDEKMAVHKEDFWKIHDMEG